MSKLKKSVAASAVADQVHKVFPNDINSHQTVFGGAMVAHIDRMALVVAERHAGQTCVTASVDALHFLAPAKQGHTLVFSAAVNRSWNSSMEIGARVEAEDSHTGERQHVVSAYLTFIAVNKDGKAVPVPELVPETEQEKLRRGEARLRREQRLRQAEELKRYRCQATGSC
jgi:acyl-CoA hydrolase